MPPPAPPPSPWFTRPSVCPVPPQVGRHRAKLFDSLCRLEFRLGDDRKPLKVGLGMHSKEDEYVHFDQECDLSGQVSAALEGQRGPLAGGVGTAAGP